MAWPHSPTNNPRDLFLRDSENGAGPIGGTLEAFANARGLHRSDLAPHPAGGADAADPGEWRQDVR